MSTITISQVRAILPVSTGLLDPQIQAAIDAACCIVERIATGCASHLTSECIDQIAIYLSAHFSAVTENTLSISKETDACCGSEMTYGFKFGKGIDGTPFGQMANLLSDGCLAQQQKMKAMLYTIGSHGEGCDSLPPRGLDC